MSFKTQLVLLIFYFIIYPCNIYSQSNDAALLLYADPEYGIIHGEKFKASKFGVKEDPEINTFGAYSELTLSDALKIAEDLIDENPNHVENWINAYVSKIIPLWSIEGLLTGYSAKIVTNEGKDTGGILIDAWDVYCPCIFSFYEDERMAHFEIVTKIYERETQKKLKQKGVKYRYLYNGLAEVALQIIDGDEKRLFSYRPDAEIKDYRAVERLKYYREFLKYEAHEDESNKMR